MEKIQDDGVYVKISDSLSQILKRMSSKQKSLVYQQMVHLKEQFEKIEQLHGRESATYSFLIEIQKQMDEISETDKKKITCSKGCAFCCMQNVDVSESEAQIALDYAKEKNIEIDYDRLHKQSKMVEVEDWLTLKGSDRHCVFLNNKTMTCDVYDARPSMCRKYAVVTPPIDCDDPGKQTARYVMLNTEIIASSLAMSAETDSLPRMILKILKKKCDA